MTLAEVDWPLRRLELIILSILRCGVYELRAHHKVPPKVAITEYVDGDCNLKGGFFLVYDKVDKKPLQLTLVKVHKEKLASLGEGVFFACTDMKSADGTVYDLDFFMMETDHGIVTTAVSVHKKSGEARYGWKEEDGVWTKVKS